MNSRLQTCLSLLTLALLTAGPAACRSPNNDSPDEVAAAALTPIADAETAARALHTVSDPGRVDSAMNEVDVGAMIGDLTVLSPRGQRRPQRLPAGAGPLVQLPAATQRFTAPLTGLEPYYRQGLAAETASGGSDEIRDCDGGGSLHLEQTAADTTSLVTATFSDCRQLNADGSYRSRSGRLQLRDSGDTQHWSLTIVAGSGDSRISTDAGSNDLHTVDYDQAGNAIAETWVSATLASAGDSAADGSAGVYSFSGDGSASHQDLLTRRGDTTYLRQVSIITRYNVSDLNGSDLQADGVVQMDSDYNQDGKPDASSYLGLRDYRLLLTSANADGADQRLQIDGKIVVSHTPAGCDDGAYQVTTITPLQGAAGVWQAGRLTLNDDTGIEVIRRGLLQVTTGGVRSELATTRLNEICPQPLAARGGR